MVELPTSHLNLADFVKEVLHSIDEHPWVLNKIVSVFGTLRDLSPIVISNFLDDVCTVLSMFVFGSLMTHHSKGFACTGLAVDEDCSIDTIKSSHRHLADRLLINPQISIILGEDGVC